MIKKPRTIPLIILMEEALLRRLPLNHPKREEILRNLEKRWTGYRGEQNLDYHLSFLPEKDYSLFQDLRLIQAKQTCQLDTLILSPHFALIIESKNIYGTLFFDQHSRQLIRTNKKQEEEGFPDPIMQAKRHKHKTDNVVIFSGSHLST
ncbi:nuclease-related domain-containing protein [Ammoniphilus sp. 3BR4]|uniref:nuclease-related domain-containing protein n=1 Tax=Ammoniphilus sp. 3BR4 TaxID=3158265 RepID=UPI0034659BDD